jgi:hypothetical protein
MIIVMIILFYLLVLLKAKETVNMFKYPQTTDCSAVQNNYDSNQQNSTFDFEYYARLDQPYTQNKQGTGAYMCYCKTLSAI